MQLWMYVLHLARPGAREQFNEQELAVMQEHFAYLQQQVKLGTVLMAGPTHTKVYGIVLVRSESEEHAMQLMLNDPAVKQRVMGAELHPFTASLVHENFSELVNHAQSDG